LPRWPRWCWVCRWRRRRPRPTRRPEVDPALRAELRKAGGADFLVYLNERADLSGAARLAGSDAQAVHVHRRLVNTAQASQPGVARHA
jgi:hypothetical protein